MRTVLLAQLFIPLCLVAWFVVRPPGDPRLIALQCACLLLVLAAAARIGVWMLPPWWTPHAAGAVLTLAALRSIRKAKTRSSVTVRDGDQVVAGSRLGAVGNSGGSDEPHLHIHAQRPGSYIGAMDGDPIPLRLDGRYLVRGDRVAVRQETGD